VTSGTILVLKDLLRKYPERYEEVLPALQRALKQRGVAGLGVDDADVSSFTPCLSH